MNSHLVVVLDRSGSMEAIRKDMEGGFNSFIAEQRKLEDPCELTLVQFDSQSIDTVLDRVPLDKVPKLVLLPRGGTPLLDAIGQTVARMNLQPQPDKVLFIIITDGWENASHEYTKAMVKSMIQQARARGWEFMYLGANVDAFAEAQALGIGASVTAGYAANAGGVGAVFTSASNSSSSYRSGLSASITQEDRDLLDKSKK